MEVGGLAQIQYPMYADVGASKQKPTSSLSASLPQTEASSDTSQTAKLEKAVGESGQASPPVVHARDSIIRTFAFEQQHRPAQRRKVAEGDLQILHQNVDLMLALTQDLELVAVGGQTVTSFKGKGASPAKGELRELAFISNLRQMLMSSRAFMGRSKQAIPQIVAFDAAFSEVTIQQEKRAIVDLRNIDLMNNAHTSEEAFKRNKNNALKGVITDLQQLDTAINKVLSFGALNVRSASSSNPLVIHAVAGSQASINNHMITPTALGQPQQFASDYVADPGDADPDDGQDDLDGLGLEGVFTINNFKVNVVTTDTLRNIAQRINHGEDFNGNGFLDTNEDLDHNNALGAGEDFNQNGVLDISEDVNFNKVLDAGEDTNSNGRLDFAEDFDFDHVLDKGTAEHGLTAHILNNRLVLIAETNGPETISLTDDNNILQDIGVLERHFMTDKLQLKNPIQEGRSLVFDLDGKQMTRTDNTVNDAIDDVTLDFRDEGGDQVRITVSNDFTHIMADLSSLVDTFNQAVTHINDELFQHGFLLRDVDVQRAKIELDDAPRKNIAFKDENKTIADVGISRLDRRRVTFFENQLSRTHSMLAGETAQGTFANIAEPPTVPNSIDTLGIRFTDDGTLLFDKAKLKEAFETDPESAQHTIRSFAKDLAERLNRTINDPDGNLVTAQNLLKEESAATTRVDSDIQDLIEASQYSLAMYTLMS